MARAALRGFRWLSRSNNPRTRVPVMAEAHHLPDTDRVEHEASEWIARLNADDVSDDDRAQCEAWCTAHPWHARTYDEMSASWREFTAAGPLVRAVALGAAMNEAVKERVPHLRWLYAILRRVRHRR
jgi:ferric-dicitrate binding protein FerR (iron transport regulator)